MSLKDDLETLDPAAEVQKAFEEAEGSPLSMKRQSAAMQMGCQVMKLITPDTKAFLKDGVYSNSILDVTIVAWLCSLSESQVIHVVATARSEDQIEKYIEEAFAWAESENMTFGSQKYIEVNNLIGKTIAGILASTYSIECKSSPPTVKKNTPRRGKSDTPISRRSRAATQPTIA